MKKLEEYVKDLPKLFREFCALKKQINTLPTVDINVENISYDENTQEIIITENDGTEYRQSLADLVEGKVDKEFLGWVQITDTEYTSANRLTIPANTRTKLTNNAGSVLNIVGLFGGATLWNPTTNKVENDNSGDKFITCDGDIDIYDILFLIERKFRNI